MPFAGDSESTDAIWRLIATPTSDEKLTHQRSIVSHAIVPCRCAGTDVVVA
jgi:hypothetical protein